MNISTDYSSYLYSAYSNNSTTSSSKSSEFADILMTSLDTDSSGSIDVTEFSEAALSLSSSSASEDSINEAFSLLDDDEDGSISLDELTSYVASASGLQNEQMMAAGSPPPPPPPPPSGEEDSGYTQDELSALATDSASSDANLSSLFETLAANFDEADANGDGRVTSAEAMAYKEAEAQASGSSENVNGENLINSVLQQIISSYNNETMRTSSFNLSA